MYLFIKLLKYRKHWEVCLILLCSESALRVNFVAEVFDYFYLCSTTMLYTAHLPKLLVYSISVSRSLAVNSVGNKDIRVSHIYIFTGTNKEVVWWMKTTTWSNWQKSSRNWWLQVNCCWVNISLWLFSFNKKTKINLRLTEKNSENQR